MNSTRPATLRQLVLRFSCGLALTPSPETSPQAIRRAEERLRSNPDQTIDERMKKWKQPAETLKANGPDDLRRDVAKLRVGRIAPFGNIGTDIAVVRKRGNGADTVISIVRV